MGQVDHIDDLVATATDAILTHSRTPPIIIVFSDHGHRYDAGDRGETVRTLFFANTPGAPGLFPPDVTPINVMARLLSQYHGMELPMASEESYYVDQQRLSGTGPFDMTLIPEDVVRGTP